MTAIHESVDSTRCITPTLLKEYNTADSIQHEEDRETPTSFSDDEDDIPHLMRPNSGEFYNEDEYNHQDDDPYGESEYCIPLPYVVEQPSPVSSISGYTRGDRSISSGGVLHQASDDGSNNADTQKSSKSKRSRRYKKEASSNRSSTSRNDEDQALTKMSPSMRDEASPLRLAPRFESGTAPLNPYSQSQSPTMDDQSNSKRMSPLPPLLSKEQKYHRRYPSSGSSNKGRESPYTVSSKPPPSPISSGKPNGFSRGISNSSRIPPMPINYSPVNMSRRTVGLSPRNPRVGGKHRRVVSFPDEVFANASSPNRLQPYHDFSLECDDPALFPMVENALTRPDGRVGIVSDVDPELARPRPQHALEHLNRANSSPNRSRNMKKKYRHRRVRSAGTSSNLRNGSHRNSDLSSEDNYHNFPLMPKSLTEDSTRKQRQETTTKLHEKKEEKFEKKKTGVVVGSEKITLSYPTKKSKSKSPLKKVRNQFKNGNTCIIQ
ncbi:predicted protein [Chaetoceros tenuissimus]|uniref:Uncharacterized protein n=1 Tax=Chaetoceros tenuissimus TaxID=426638 RepID=A0AAD3D1F7_9STRA|nr:predicted protein [Chaetoceros tenuissimus]